MTSIRTRAALMASGLAAALVLSGCREEAAVPSGEPLFVPAATDAAYGLPVAPDWQALPSAPAAPVRYAPDYGYAERAYALDRAFYEAPPDYGFSYVDAQPWAWRTDEGYEVFAEPIDDGYRYYYYEPYEPYPFFVRTPDYGYGYGPGGVLSVVYSSLGVILPTTYVVAQAEPAGVYWGRARSLYVASRHHRAPVVYDAWLSRRPAFVASQARWMQAADRDDDWRRWRDRHDRRELRRFEPERERREQAVARMEREEVRQAVDRVNNERGWRDRRRPDDPRQLASLERRDDRARRPEQLAAPPADRARPERDRPERDRRADRSDVQHGERVASVDRRGPPRIERPQRVEPPFRADRPQPERQARQRPDRQQTERPQMQRPEGPEAQARIEQRAERPQREERPARQARPERVERQQVERPQMQRPDRPERQARIEQRAERPQRQERPQQQAAQPDHGGQGAGGRPAREGRQHGRER